MSMQYVEKPPRNTQLERDEQKDRWERFRRAAQRLHPKATLRQLCNVQESADKDGAFVELTVWVPRQEIDRIMVDKIVSGGQTGADRAALETARDLGIKTGGWAPLGYRTEKGEDVSLKKFGLVEHPSPLYPERTKANVKDSDGTVWFGNISSPGYRCTAEAVAALDKPWLVNPDPPALLAWCERHKIKVLNVAGNRASSNKNIARTVAKTLIVAFGSLLG